MVFQRERGRGGERFDLARLKTIPITAVATELGFRLSARGNGCCQLPGHDDTTPSFSIRENRFRCFACDQKGDVIQLVMLMHGMNFATACLWLESRYFGGGARLKYPTSSIKPTDRSSAAPSSSSRSASFDAVFDAEVFTWILENSPLRADGAAYLYSRGYLPDTVAHFRVGQVNDRRLILRHAMSKFGSVRLRSCGVLADYERGEQLVFPSGYLLFPFIAEGKITYLQGRRADQEKKWRWLCPKKLLPPTYNIDVLAGSATTIGICEGVTDVLSAHQLGWNAIGLVGAGARPDATVLSRLAGRNVVIFGDADKAGAALSRGITQSLRSHGTTVIRKRFPPGINDLNDYLRHTQERFR